MNVSISQKNSNTIESAAVKKIADDLKLNEKLVELLFLRGIDNEEAIRRFLYPDVDMFYNPKRLSFTAIMTPTAFAPRRFWRYFLFLAVWTFSFIYPTEWATVTA